MALAGGLMSLTAPLATAADGTVTAGYGFTRFIDATDTYRVCDTDTDGVGVSGRISVRQADGSWNHFPWLRDPVADGLANCASNSKDVLREAATIELTICRQEGPSGVRYACETARVG